MPRATGGSESSALIDSRGSVATLTDEFKLAAVLRLEKGISLGEVARALEVNPNVLHRWRRELRQGPGNVFPGYGKQQLAGRTNR